MIIPEIIKRPSEKYTLGLRYTSPDLEEGAYIASCSVSISPSEPSGLQLWGSVQIDENIVRQGVQGGEDGQEYYVTFLTVTSENNTFEDSIYVKVRSVS